MADTQNAANLYENYLRSGVLPRTHQDLANLRSSIENDDTLDEDDRAQLLADMQALAPYLNGGESANQSVSAQQQSSRAPFAAPASDASQQANYRQPQYSQDLSQAQSQGEVQNDAANYIKAAQSGQSSSAPHAQASGGSSSDFLSVLKQNPDMVNSLKKYVKSQQQKSLLDAVLDAMQGSDDNSDDQNKNAKKSKKSPLSGQAASSGNSSGAVAPQAAPSVAPQAAPSVAPQAAGGVSGQAGGNGLSFAPGAVSANDNASIPAVNSGITLTQGGAQAGAGNTAELDGWDSNLGLTNPGNIDQFLMMVLLASYEDGQKGLEMMAKNLQKTNNQKKALRQQLSGLYNQKTGDEKADTAVDARIQDVQGQLSSASDDAQLQQLQLQNATQNQQTLLQEISSFSKNLYDASMNILRKIGS